MTPELKQADIDRLARELYSRQHLCSACFGRVTWAERFGGHCPHCSAVIMAGPIRPERARAMLAELKARRAELGLAGEGA